MDIFRFFHQKHFLLNVETHQKNIFMQCFPFVFVLQRTHRNSYKTNKNWNWIENFTLTNTLSFLLWRGLLETLWGDAVKTLNTVPSTRICTRVLGKTNDNAVIFYLDKAAVCRVNGPRTGNEKLDLIVQMNLAARLECSEVRGWKRRNLNRSLRGSFQPNILFGKM